MALPLCVRIDHDDQRSAASLQAAGFRWIEVLLTYQLDPRHWLAPAADRARPEDIGDVVELVASAFTYDRLHSDPEVARKDADDAKRQWARDSLAQRECFVKRIDGQLAGFCSLNLGQVAHRVDLICVDPEFHGKGIGRALLEGALAHYSPCGLIAGTQQKNEPARKLYEGLGMHVIKRQATWHLSR